VLSAIDDVYLNGAEQMRGCLATPTSPSAVAKAIRC